MRIYCLTSIIVKDATNNSQLEEECKNEEFFYPENNTKIVMETIKNNPKIFNTYQLTEICIGYHFISEKRVYLLLIYRKDTQLIVINMVPGSVTFHSITNQVFEFNVATSKLFSNSANFDLVIRVRCIKNTQVRGPISEEEIQYYENFAKEIEDFSKNESNLQETAFGIFTLNLPNQSSANVFRTKISDTSTLIKLLCDPKSGNVENVPTASRYCQKVKCLWNAKKVSKKVEKTNQSPNFLFQKDDNKNDVEIDATKIEKNFTNGPNADIPELSCKSIGLSNNSRGLEEENVKTMELYSNISEERRKSESKRIGRPKRYETKEECKKARAEASKKYSLKKSREFEKMKKAVISMEKTNEYLNEKLKNLALQFAENPRNEIPNLPKPNFIENLTNSNDSSKNDSQADKNVKPNTKQTDNDKFDKLSSHEKRREQQRLAVQRVRERRKAEEKQLYVRKELCQKQNEELEEKIESINKLMEWMKKSTDEAAKRSTKNYNEVISDQNCQKISQNVNDNILSSKNTELNAKEAEICVQNPQPSCSKIIRSSIDNPKSLSENADFSDKINGTDDTELNYNNTEKFSKHTRNLCKLNSFLSKIMDQTKKTDDKKNEMEKYNFQGQKSIPLNNSAFNYANLSALKLHDCNITVLCDCIFETLPLSLTIMDLSKNNILHISNSISKLTNLESLYLNDNPKFDQMPWKCLPSNLKELEISNNSIQEISDISHLSKLCRLKINCNKIKNISPLISALESLKHFEIEKNYLSELPCGFESHLYSLKYLNLSNNLFHNSDGKLDEKLWKRLPPNISMLILDGNNLFELPCLLKSRKLCYLAVNNCNLTNICPFFIKANAVKEKEFIFEIQKNPDLKELPFFPEIFYKSGFTKAETSKNFLLSKINVITDNEDFISTSRIPKMKKEFEFKKCEDEKYCQCCAGCGKKERDEKMIEKIMIMDFNLIIGTFDFDIDGLHGNEKMEEIILKKRIEKIVHQMNRFYGPGKWKTKVKSRLCSNCFNEMKEKAFKDSKQFELNKRKRKITENESSTIPSLIPQILPPIQFQQNSFLKGSVDDKQSTFSNSSDYNFNFEQQSKNTDTLKQIKLEKIDSEFDSFCIPESQKHTPENTVEYEHLYCFEQNYDLKKQSHNRFNKN